MPITTIVSMYILELLVQRKLQKKNMKYQPCSWFRQYCTAIPTQGQQEGENHPQLLVVPAAGKHRPAAKVEEGWLCLPGGLSSSNPLHCSFLQTEGNELFQFVYLVTPLNLLASLLLVIT